MIRTDGETRASAMIIRSRTKKRIVDDRRRSRHSFKLDRRCHPLCIAGCQRSASLSTARLDPRCFRRQSFGQQFRLVTFFASSVRFISTRCVACIQHQAFNPTPTSNGSRRNPSKPERRTKKRRSADQDEKKGGRRRRMRTRTNRSTWSC